MLKIYSSGVARNLICPASLIHDQVFIKKEESKYAIEGTEKHLEMERAVTHGELTPLAATFLTQMQILEPSFTFDKCLAEEKLVAKFSTFSLIGKLDLMYLCEESSTLHIIDYKFGYNQVDATDNAQLLAYALLAFQNYPVLDLGLEIKCSIYQDEMLRTVLITHDSIQTFLNQLTDAVKKAHEGVYIPHADACKYCNFRPECPTLITKVADIVEPTNILNKKDLIARNLKLIKYVTEDVEKDLKMRLKSGEKLDYVELKSNGTMSSWATNFTQDEIKQELVELGAEESDLFDVKLKSVSAVKKILKTLPDHLVNVSYKEKSLKFIDKTVETIDLFE